METTSPPEEAALPVQAERPPAPPAPPHAGGTDLDVAPPRSPPPPEDPAPGAAGGIAKLRKRSKARRPDGAGGGAGLAMAPAGIATPGGAHRPPGLLRSAGFRFAVLFAVLFATAALVLVGTLWLVTAGTLDRQTDMRHPRRRARAGGALPRRRDDEPRRGHRGAARGRHRERQHLPARDRRHRPAPGRQPRTAGRSPGTPPRTGSAPASCTTAPRPRRGSTRSSCRSCAC